MTVLEQVIEMNNQGIAEEEIVKKLQDQGVSPKAINDALNQTKIKEAVSKEEGFEGYEKSENLTQSPKREAKPQEISDEGMYYPQQEENYYSPDYSQYQEDSTYSPGFDTSTIIEISEQVFSEKIQKIQSQVDEFSEFKTLAESKIENISERIKRIESIVDKLQISILEKIGSYGSNLEHVKKEMSMMQDSFSKMINPLARRAEEKHIRKLRKPKVHVKMQTKKVKRR